MKKMEKKSYYKYMWFFKDLDRMWHERYLGEDKEEAKRLAWEDMKLWVKNSGGAIDESCMALYEVNRETWTPYNEDRTLVVMFGNTKYYQPDPEKGWA